MRRLARVSTVAVVAGFVVAGCSLSTGSSANKPTVAHLAADGTAPSGSLQLVVSTSFETVQDTLTGNIDQVFYSSDTLSVDLPYADDVPLTSEGRVAVRLKNVSSSDVTVDFEVRLDNGQGYHYQAALPQGQELKYAYVYR